MQCAEDHPVAVKPEISYETYHTIDIVNVAILARLQCMAGIRKDKRALTFHIGSVASPAINVLLTDWKADRNIFE